jgi:HlyD family secretion protein
VIHKYRYHLFSASCLGRCACLILLGVIATSGCARTSPAIAAGAGAVAGRRVEVIHPERRTIRRISEQPGEIEAFETTPIYAKVSGYIERWTTDIGARVSKGALLARLSVPELDAESLQMQAAVEQAQAIFSQAKASERVAHAQLSTAQAKLVEARASIARTQAELDRWQSEFKRVEQLFNERAQTGTLLDETQSKLRSSQALREETSAQIKTAEAAVEHARSLVEKSAADVLAAASAIKVARFALDRVNALDNYASIVAPYDGLIIERHANTGDLTHAGAQGIPLFVISRRDVVRVVVSVPEMLATAVEPGDKAIIQIQSLGDKKLEAKVSRTARTLDPRNRTLRVEIDVSDPRETLIPGLYVTAGIIVDEHAGVLLVPVSAVARQDSRAHVVMVIDGKARRQPITAGLSDGMYVEIASGLDGSETLAKDGVTSLTDGQPLSVIVPETAKGKP